MSRFRHVAPAGTPIGAPTLARWALRAAASREAVSDLSEAVRARFGVRQCVPTVTGRAGLVLILRALARLAPTRTEVVLPGYTCYTVAASILCAGLQPRVVDVAPTTLDFDPEALARTDFSRVLAVVPTSLFGLPADLPALSRLSAREGVRLVDDAAQAMGAEIDGRRCGTWGDAGLFSLDKGKNITAIEGGLAVTGDADVARALEAEAAALAVPPRAHVARDAVKLLAYALLLRPWLYWIPNRIPQLQLGATVYTPTIPFERYNHVLAAMGLVMLGRLDTLNEGRRATAALVDAAVADAPDVTRIRVAAGGHAVYLRYPLLARDRAHRDVLVARLLERGIGASTSYPTAIVDIPELASVMAPFQRAADGARDVASRLFTLPTHAFVSHRDIAVIRDCLHAPVPTSRGVSTPAKGPS